MPSLFTRTFALLNNTKPPVLEDPADLSNADVTLFEQEIVRHTYTSTPEITIWKAAEIGDIAAVQYYLDESNGLDASTLVNTRDPDTDCTLLHIIASSGQKHTSPEQSVVYLFEMMIKHGADVTARNVYNVQAIHMVALHCPEPYLPMKLLLNHGASPNARDGDAWTPLHYAARFCHPPDKVVQLLVSRGADVNLLDATNKTAIFSLLANGDHTDLFDWFIHKAKSDISVQGDFLDKTSRQTRVCTILTQIAKYGRMDCMLLILRSPEAIRQLSRVVTQSELDYAMALAKDQMAGLKANEQNKKQLFKFESMSQLLYEMRDILDKDPQSRLSIEKTFNVNQSDVVREHQLTRRSSSFVAMLGSMGKKKLERGRSKKSGTSNLLYRTMSRMVKMSRNEGMTPQVGECV